MKKATGKGEERNLRKSSSHGINFITGRIKSGLFLLSFFILGILSSCNPGDNATLKEWSVKCSQDQQGNYEWDGTLYCNETGINWKHKNANDFIGQYLPNGNHWQIEKNDIEFIGMGDTITSGGSSEYVEIVTKNSKHYFLKADTPEENKKMVEYLVDHYMQ